MHDDFLTRDWAAGHQHVTRSINAALRDFAAAFARFHAARFDAPWLQEQRAPAPRRY